MAEATDKIRERADDLFAQLRIQREVSGSFDMVQLLCRMTAKAQLDAEDAVRQVRELREALTTETLDHGHQVLRS